MRHPTLRPRISPRIVGDDKLLLMECRAVQSAAVWIRQIEQRRIILMWCIQISPARSEWEASANPAPGSISRPRRANALPWSRNRKRSETSPRHYRRPEDHAVAPGSATRRRTGAGAAARSAVRRRRGARLAARGTHRERGDCLVVNHYGPTETTVGALVNPVDRNARRDGATVPIGRALAGDEAFVLDTRGRLAPVGAVGELAIGGAGLARGYWADDARTASDSSHTRTGQAVGCT